MLSTQKEKEVKICVLTGSRAEFGLFMPLLKLLQGDSFYKLQLLVTGTHLSPEFGMTYTEIEKAGFSIDEKVEILLSSDTHVGTVKSTGLALIGFADSFERLKPDWVVVLGDRFETFAAATAAYLAKIPIIHLHGGETTEGATDEALRHSITKMSYLHFTSTEKYRNRVIQLGEQPNRVFDVGAIGLDNIKSLSLLSKEELSESLDFVLDSPYLLITFHPVTLESNTSEQQFKILLDTLDQYKDLKIIFTLPNADADGRIIIKLVEAYVKENNDRVRSFTSLGQLRFLSALKYASAVVGNSSSGIIEAPSFKIPTINIGDRQKGRIQAATVINAEPNPTSITSAMDEALSSTFKQMCSTTTNPYGEGDTAERIMKILKSHSTIKSLKKKFFDLAV